MSSSSILPNKYFNRLQVNRLQAQNADIINDDLKSFLFSLLFKSATFTKNNTGGTLTFSSSDVDSVIQFTDRPFRQTTKISIDDFIDLFSILGINTFTDDPPNGVLVSGEEQKTYELKTATRDVNGKYKIELELIDGEAHSNRNKVSGRFSLFVDHYSQPHLMWWVGMDTGIKKEEEEEEEEEPAAGDEDRPEKALTKYVAGDGDGLVTAKQIGEDM